MENLLPPPPLARERNRDGLRALRWKSKPDAGEARVDKTRIKVTGHIEWSADASFEEFLATIVPGAFNAPYTPGTRYKSPLAGTKTVSGMVEIFEQRPHRRAFLRYVLDVNPTRTRRRALAIAAGSGLSELSASRFFTALPPADEAYATNPRDGSVELALDGKDNVLLSATQLGGTTPDERARANTAFLQTFEDQLKRLLITSLCLPSLGYSLSEEGCRATSGDGRFTVNLDWHRLLIQHAEIYWERSVPDPVSVVRRLEDRGVELARRIKAGRYEGHAAFYGVDHDDGFSSLIIPLTGDRSVELAIYAKTNRRVRFEVRYRRDFGHLLKGCVAKRTGRLVSVWERLAKDAEKRLPWPQLADAASTPPDVDIAEIGDLVAHLGAAAEYEPVLFNALVRRVLITGGVIADEARIPGVVAAIAQLVRRGVLTRTGFQLKEQKSGRRFGLSARFSQVRLKMLRGFAPAEVGTGEWDGWENEAWAAPDLDWDGQPINPAMAYGPPTAGRTITPSRGAKGFRPKD